MKDKFRDYFLRIAEETSKLSSAIKLQVGAVIVKDNRILSIGYNGTPSGWDNTCEFENVLESEFGDITITNLRTKPEVLHAEANALMKLTQSTESSKDAIIFTTHAPCIECAKLIYQAGIKQLYYSHSYTATKGSGLSFLNEAGVKVCHVQKK